MEQKIIDFIFNEAQQKETKPNEFRLLCIMAYKYLENGRTETNNIRELGKTMAYPTLLKTLDSLSMLGYIRRIETDGNFSKYEFTFLKKIVDRANNVKSVDVIDHSDDDFSAVFNLKDRENVSRLAYKEILHTLPETYKETLLSTDFSIKKLYNETGICIKKLYTKATIGIKKLYGNSADNKETLHENRKPYKVSLHYLTFDNPLKTISLIKTRQETHAKVRQKLAKIGYIYNKEYIYLLDIIDLTLFGGNILRFILKEEEDKDPQVEDKLKSKPFELTKKTIRECPVKFQSSNRFISTYGKWLDYRKNQKKAPVGYYSAMEDIKKLCSVEDPIETISFSMRVSAKNLIFKEVETDESQKETGTGGGNFSII